MAFSRQFVNDNVFFANKIAGKGPRPPLKTFTEMAEEFGLKPGQLRYQMAHSKHCPPKPELISCGTSVGNRYYNPTVMRAWWQLHNDLTCATQPE